MVKGWWVSLNYRSGREPKGIRGEDLEVGEEQKKPR